MVCGPVPFCELSGTGVNKLTTYLKYLCLTNNLCYVPHTNFPVPVFGWSHIVVTQQVQKFPEKVA